ncbi:MAG: hypothetical protein ACQER9_02580 [Nanobdellota archaeon]
MKNLETKIDELKKEHEQNEHRIEEINSEIDSLSAEENFGNRKEKLDFEEQFAIEYVKNKMGDLVDKEKHPELFEETVYEDFRPDSKECIKEKGQKLNSEGLRKVEEIAEGMDEYEKVVLGEGLLKIYSMNNVQTGDILGFVNMTAGTKIPDAQHYELNFEIVKALGLEENETCHYFGTNTDDYNLSIDGKRYPEFTEERMEEVFRKVYERDKLTEEEITRKEELQKELENTKEDESKIKFEFRVAEKLGEDAYNHFSELMPEFVDYIRNKKKERGIRGLETTCDLENNIGVTIEDISINTGRGMQYTKQITVHRKGGDYESKSFIYRSGMSSSGDDWSKDFQDVEIVSIADDKTVLKASSNETTETLEFRVKESDEIKEPQTLDINPAIEQIREECTSYGKFYGYEMVNPTEGHLINSGRMVNYDEPSIESTYTDPKTGTGAIVAKTQIDHSFANGKQFQFRTYFVNKNGEPEFKGGTNTNQMMNEPKDIPIASEEFKKYGLKKENEK